MSDQLETLFPIDEKLVIRGKEYPIKKITVAQMANANKLAALAFGSMPASNLVFNTEMDVAVYITDAISVMFDGGEYQNRLNTLVAALTEMDQATFNSLEIKEVVDVVIAVVVENKDFFILRVPATLRQECLRLIRT